jgi:2,3-bisphosphoglycerate-dependent phosphoglycerate mutase
LTTLLLARHGETDWNRERRLQGSTDIPLNDLGRTQAKRLATELEDVELTAIYSSDLQRARETAEIVAAAKKLRVHADRGLRERSFGSWEGLTRQEIAERFGDLEHHDGESDEDVRSRVLAVMHRIVTSNPEGNVLVVSHGSALNALWHHAGGERLERWGNCIVYRLAVRDGKMTPVD